VLRPQSIITPPRIVAEYRQPTWQLWRDTVVTDRSRLPLIGLLKALDLTLVMLSFGVTTLLVIHTENSVSLVQFLEMRTRISNFCIFSLALLISHFIFVACGMYRSRRLSGRWAEMRDLLKVTTLLVACFAGLRAVFPIRMITLPFLGLFWITVAVVLCGARLILRFLVAHVRSHGRNLRFVLILGTNSRGVAFARKITRSPELGYRLLGFVDDEWPGLETFAASGFPLVSNYTGLPGFLRKNVVDEVALFLPFGSLYKHSAEVASLCAEQGIIMRINSDVFGLKGFRRRGDEVDGSDYIITHAGIADGWPLAAKRFLDILIASVSIVLLSPVLLGAAVAIKLSFSGPIFFLQERVGLNKRRFRVYKFRTMVPQAEKLMAALETRNEMGGPVFKMQNDPRITPVGRFLRRSSIDELPQLLNVLKGDMSLVGPRPLPVRDYEGFNKDWQRRRFSVKPGITCLWQVNGRSGISFDQWMLLDLQYMDEWTLWLDLKILAKTVPAVLKGAGAA
jgi:exopolysaccharide biosynthesis polyprenyl glycosylphosphotransferase